MTSSGPVTALDDAAIVEVSRTEPEAFAELFSRHAAVLHRYLARRVGAGVADDLVAETFLAAFRRRERYDGAYRDARPWLYGIASNLVGQHRREESRLLRLRAATASRAEHAESGTFERVTTAVMATSVRDALGAAVADLPSGERDVLVLVAWEQLRYDEVARALDIPIGTVRSRLSRARARVRHALARPDLSETLKEILNDA